MPKVHSNQLTTAVPDSHDIRTVQNIRSVKNLKLGSSVRGSYFLFIISEIVSDSLYCLKLRFSGGYIRTGYVPSKTIPERLINSL